MTLLARRPLLRAGMNSFGANAPAVAVLPTASQALGLDKRESFEVVGSFSFYAIDGAWQLFVMNSACVGMRAIEACNFSRSATELP